MAPQRHHHRSLIPLSDKIRLTIPPLATTTSLSATSKLSNPGDRRAYIAPRYRVHKPTTPKPSKTWRGSRSPFFMLSAYARLAAQQGRPKTGEDAELDLELLRLIDVDVDEMEDALTGGIEQDVLRPASTVTSESSMAAEMVDESDIDVLHKGTDLDSDWEDVTMSEAGPPAQPVVATELSPEVDEAANASAPSTSCADASETTESSTETATSQPLPLKEPATFAIQNQSPFLGLPGELRNMIYTYTHLEIPELKLGVTAEGKMVLARRPLELTCRQATIEDREANWDDIFGTAGSFHVNAYNVGLDKVGNAILHWLPNDREAVKLTVVMGFDEVLKTRKVRARHACPMLFHKVASQNGIKKLDLRVEVRYGRSEEVEEVMSEKLAKVWKGWEYARWNGGTLALSSRRAQRQLWAELDEEARLEAIADHAKERRVRRDEERRARAVAKMAELQGDSAEA